ncbi:MAG: hypothetical protein K2Y13_16570 [Burkholderiaceae bacterium]|nr:hypothetical protein [Burkholderiaceae bacterium]
MKNSVRERNTVKKIISLIVLVFCVLHQAYAQQKTFIAVGGTPIALPIPAEYVSGKTNAKGMYDSIVGLTTSDITTYAIFFHRKDVDLYKSGKKMTLSEPFYTFSNGKPYDHQSISQREFEDMRYEYEQAYLQSVVQLSKEERSVFESAKRKDMGKKWGIQGPLHLSFNNHSDSAFTTTLVAFKKNGEPELTHFTVLRIKSKLLMFIRNSGYENRKGMIQSDIEMKNNIDAILAANK